MAKVVIGIGSERGEAEGVRGVRRIGKGKRERL